MLHMCMWRDLCSKFACCVEAAHNTHPRAMRTSTTPPRRAPLAHSPLCTVHTYINSTKLVLRARPPLAGGVPWSPTRGRGPCEARAKQPRLSIGDDAHQRSSAHVSLTAFCCESCAQDMRPAASRGEDGCAPRGARAVGILPRPLRGLCGPRHFCQHLLSCLDVHCGTVEPPQPQASATSSATFISASSAWSHGAPRWTRGKTFAAFHRPLHHARSFCVVCGEIFFGSK